MKTLESLNQDQLIYLKQQWIAEVAELNKKISERHARLDRRIDRNEERNELHEQMQERLNQAQQILTALQQSEGNAEIIASQQAMVDQLQQEYNEAINDSVSLNPIDVQEELIEIKTQERTVILLQEKIEEIEALLAA